MCWEGPRQTHKELRMFGNVEVRFFVIKEWNMHNRNNN